MIPSLRRVIAVFLTACLLADPSLAAHGYGYTPVHPTTVQAVFNQEAFASLAAWWPHLFNRKPAIKAVALAIVISGALSAASPQASTARVTTDPSQFILVWHQIGWVFRQMALLGSAWIAMNVFHALVSSWSRMRSGLRRNRYAYYISVREESSYLTKRVLKWVSFSLPVLAWGRFMMIQKQMLGSWLFPYELLSPGIRDPVLVGMGLGMMVIGLGTVHVVFRDPSLNENGRVTLLKVIVGSAAAWVGMTLAMPVLSQTLHMIDIQAIGLLLVTTAGILISIGLIIAPSNRPRIPSPITRWFITLLLLGGVTAGWVPIVKRLIHSRPPASISSGSSQGDSMRARGIVLVAGLFLAGQSILSAASRRPAKPAGDDIYTLLYYSPLRDVIMKFVNNPWLSLPIILGLGLIGGAAIVWFVSRRERTLAAAVMTERISAILAGISRPRMKTFFAGPRNDGSEQAQLLDTLARLTQSQVDDVRHEFEWTGENPPLYALVDSARERLRRMILFYEALTEAQDHTIADATAEKLGFRNGRLKDAMGLLKKWPDPERVKSITALAKEHLEKVELKLAQLPLPQPVFYERWLRNLQQSMLVLLLVSSDLSSRLRRVA